MERKVTIGDKEYIVKEIPYLEAVDTNTDDKKAMISKIISMSVGLTDEEVKALTLREGIKLQQAVDEVNGLKDFLQATEETEKKQS